MYVWPSPYHVRQTARGHRLAPWGGAARRGAWGDTLGWGSPDRLYKDPTDCTKPRQTIQSPRNTIQRPNRLYKAPTDNTKTQNIRPNLQKHMQQNMQNPQILDKNQNY